MADITSGQDVDVISHVPGTGATNLGKAEDAGHTTGDTGVMVLAVQQAATGSLVSTDLDYAPFQVDVNGSLKTNTADFSQAFDLNAAGSSTITGLNGANTFTVVITGTNGSNTIFFEGSIDASTWVSLQAFPLPSGPPVTASVGVTGSWVMDCSGLSAVRCRYSGIGTHTLGTMRISNASLGGPFNFIKNEDVASADADAGIPAMAVRKGTPANTSGSDGDYEFLQMSAGRLWVDPSGVTLTVGSHAVTNAGTFAVQVDGSALTSLQLIDDAVYADDAARSKSLLIGAVLDDTSPTTITENNAGYLRMSSRRALLVEGVASGTAIAANTTQLGGTSISTSVGTTDAGTQRVVQANGTGRTLVSVGGSAASSGNNTLIAAGTNKLKVYSFSLTTTSTTAVTCIFQSGAGGTELWRLILQAPTSVSAGANLAVTPPAFLFATASATLLNLNLSSAQTVHYSIAYFDEA